jgi:tetratricopeptide (TPR) repeat protein
MQRKIVLLFFSVVSATSLILLSVSNIYAADNYELLVAQGIQRINEEKYSEALEFLEKALELSPEDPEATYYSAITFSRLNELERAEELFLKILKDDKSATNVYYELGFIYYVKASCAKSNDYLSKFISRSDDESLKNYAGHLIEDCYDTEKADKEEKSYKLNITVGGQYDDNVTIEPENPVKPADRKSDGKIIAYLTTAATLFKKGVISLKADYNFYQSIHFDLNDFNVHYHKITPALEIDISNTIKPTVGYSYEHTLFGGERYSGVNTFFTNLNIKESEYLSTDVIYKYRDLRYEDSELFETNSIRTGYQNTIGVMQDFHINRLSGDVYYFSEHNRADEEYWSFNGYKLGAELVYQIISPMYLTIVGEYSENRYRDDYLGSLEKRFDKMQHYTVVLTYKISRRMNIYFSEDYSINDSNLSDFEYKRNIAGIFLTVAVL